VGRWGHSVDFALPYQIELLADGRIERCNREGTWSLSGTTLTLQWTTASGGTQVERVTVSSDGTWYAGRAAAGSIIRGARVE
jgi:hypothetical protein